MSSPKRTRKPTQRTSVTVDFTPKGDRQIELVKGIEENTVIFATGVAGTGKTLVAVATALQALLAKKVAKIILIRPAVQAGPEIGFLPGSLDEKIGPFMAPCMDALYKLLPDYVLESMFEEGQIEIVSIAYSRGLNFENSVVIVDECENLDRKSMFLLLTRICDNTKMIFSGDVLQSDLPGRTSSLQDTINMFRDEEDFFIIKFTLEDVKRNKVVKKVIEKFFPYEHK